MHDDHRLRLARALRVIDDHRPYGKDARERTTAGTIGLVSHAMGALVTRAVRELGEWRVADGRSLAVCEVGDPEGRPVLYLHGTGSSRLECALYSEAAERLGIRMIAWDRPGAGRSVPQPGRELHDVVADARQVAATAGADRPVVLGLSGGGSHVLALAALGSDFVGGAIAVNPGPPPDERVLQALPSKQIASFVRLAARRPAMFQLFARQVESRSRVVRALKLRLMDPLDAEVLRDPVTGPRFETAIEEGALQKGAYAAEALMLWQRPWEFDWTAPRVALHVCAGRRDPLASFSRQLGEMASADVHWFDGGHISGFRTKPVDEVLGLVLSA